jgi:beta-glucosidase
MRRQLERVFTLTAALSAAAVALVTGQPPPPYKNPQLPVEQRVADLLGRMTLEEKVAQTLSVWQQKSALVNAEGVFDADKAATVLQYGIGEVTRPSDGVDRGGRRRSPRETAEFVNAIQRWVVEQTRLGIPVMFHEEALHGLAALRGTNFPVPIALASTWDDALVERVFTVAAREVRARGSHHVLAPVLDLARDPRWGRTEETYGEDTYLATCLGVAAIRGYQGASATLGPERVFATMKHYAAHGPHEGGINAAPTNVSERLLRDELLPPFEAAVREAHVASVMPSYN